MTSLANKLKQLSLKLAFEKCCMHNLGEDQRKVNSILLQNRTEQNRTEQNRTEQNRTEQNRTEQNQLSMGTSKSKFSKFIVYFETGGTFSIIKI